MKVSSCFRQKRMIIIVFWICYVVWSIRDWEKNLKQTKIFFLPKLTFRRAPQITGVPCLLIVKKDLNKWPYLYCQFRFCLCWIVHLYYYYYFLLFSSLTVSLVPGLRRIDAWRDFWLLVPRLYQHRNAAVCDGSKKILPESGWQSNF